jgi:ADP-heptose:LPS heptosyltransferase
MKSPALVLPVLEIREFAALCAQMDLFLGNDSGPLHVAATQTFVVGLFGPTLPEICAPWTKGKLIITGAKPSCRPCRQEGCPNENFNLCLKSITAEEVICALRVLLSQIHKSS